MSRRASLLIVALGALFVACQGADSEQQAAPVPLEVEEIALPVDSSLSTDADRKGPPRVQGVAGVLPSDYPRGLPTHEPSSVHEVGDLPDGGRFVDFDSPTAASTVVRSLGERLTTAGWQLTTERSGAILAFKDGVRVGIEVADLYSGSRIRVEYR